MIKLHGKTSEQSELLNLKDRQILRICRSSRHPPINLNYDALFERGEVAGDYIEDYQTTFIRHDAAAPSGQVEFVRLPPELEYLDDGDIICFEKASNFIRVLYRKSSPHNSMLLTERCNHYCLMCSQPPRDINDGFLVSEILEAIPLMHGTTGELGLSGGEPTITGQSFFDIIEACKIHLPNTALHILTNGRFFNKIEHAQRISAINHHDLMLGIPLYSDHPPTHNFVVQANNAFDEAVRGIINLKSCDVKVEIRFVLHKYTVPRLRQFSEFIKRNLLFVDHIAFMGLETIGFARSNIKEIWVDPSDYMDDLSYACNNIAEDGSRVSLYNSQLCLIPKSLHAFYKHSISDWKNEFLDECKECYAKSHCCGFFASNEKFHSSKIKAIENNASLETLMTGK